MAAEVGAGRLQFGTGFPYAEPTRPALAERYPEVSFVLAHAGAQHVEHHIRIARQVARGTSWAR